MLALSLVAVTNGAPLSKVIILGWPGLPAGDSLPTVGKLSAGGGYPTGGGLPA